MRTFSRGVSRCAGPNHAATASGSVHALNTASRGASKNRVMRTSRSAATSAIVLPLPAQVRVEPVHPRLPGPLARLHPCHRVVERLGLHPARPPLRLAAAGDQPGALEDLEVARDRRKAHVKRRGDLVDRRLALGQAGEDRPARGVGEGGERLAELVGRHLTHLLDNENVKYSMWAFRASDAGPRAVYVRRRLESPRPSCHASMTMWSAGSPMRTTTSSEMSRRKRCDVAPGSVTSSTVPAIFASPRQPAGSAEPLCNAKRGSRCRSSALTACHIDPSHASPSANSTSVPLMRGEPSRRSVASVLWVKASKNVRASALSSGACPSTSRQLGTAAVLSHDGRGDRR